MKSAPDILSDLEKFRRFEETFHSLHVLLRNAATTLGEEEFEWCPLSVSRGLYSFLKEGVLCGLRRADPAAELFPDDMDSDELDLLRNTRFPPLDIDRDTMTIENLILEAYERWLMQGCVLTGRIASGYGGYHHDHVAIWWCSECSTWHSLHDPPRHVVGDPLLNKIRNAFESDPACEEYQPFETYHEQLRTGH